MCGAIDCPSCGSAQGYEVVQVWRNGRRVWINPEETPDDLETPDMEPDWMSEADEIAAADRREAEVHR